MTVWKRYRPIPDLLEIVLPALLTGLAVVSIHAPLGLEVLSRGIIFIDLAVAQIAGLLVTLWQPDQAWLVVQVSALIAAVLAAGFFRWVERAMPKEQEAVIGSSFVVAASLVLLVLADHPHGREHFQDILSGQLLFVAWADIAKFLPAHMAALALWVMVPRVRRGLPFYVLFAVVVTVSVQLVGVYVVFASLILPALAVNNRDRGRMLGAMACGASAVVGGIAVSVLADIPTGPFLVLAFAVAMVVFRGVGCMWNRRGTA